MSTVFPFAFVPTFSWPAAPGGLLYTFAAGGTTNQATYSDDLGTVTNSNPVVLDANGSATVRIDPNLSYHFVLTDQSGFTTLWDQDNYQVGPFTPTYAITDAEIAASVVPPNLGYPAGDVRRYGAILDGATDCVAALALACQVGGAISVLGKMALASASLAALNGITLASNTTIRGVPGMPWTVTGTTACQVFASTDASNVHFEDVYCIGNNVGTASLGYFWYSKHTVAAVKDATDIQFIRGGLENFAGNYWIYFDNTAATAYAVRKITVDGARFVSKAGNCQYPTLITGTASVFGFSGSNSLTSFYTVTDVVVRNCVADGTYIKNFLYFWSGCIRCKAHNNILNGFGTYASISNDTACYALAAYDFSHGTGLQPNEIEFDNNTIDGVRDVGIYLAGTNVVSARGNRIGGQISTANSTIPKGGIAGNTNFLTVLDGNIFNNCVFGVGFAMAPTTDSVLWILNTTVETMAVSGFGLLLSGTSAGAAPKIVVDGFRCKAQAAATGTTAIQINATATVGMTNLDLLNIEITGCNTGIYVNAPDATVPALGNVRIANVKMLGINTTNLEFSGCTSTSQRIVLENLTFASMQAGAVGLYLASMPNVTVRNVVFEDMSSGATYCWYAGGAQGRVSGVQYVNVATANRYDGAANRMGVDAPGWTGNDNDFVQNLNPTVAGSGGFGTSNQKHFTAGWQYDAANAAWTPDVHLTGT